ncbi:AAA family ATPase [Pseudomonas aeruginosa]|uniref:AAA family ATPase n=1 Tax=Pseudomonas aeruginosa TaxID=287 RepID=A0A6A9JYV1_PSEAI|nr:AAA family ATPase [Pseudomonas aeruginosa]MDG3820261.1 AAA family ATPase [Pseudomonas aeruginosa]MUI58109.1 AAA family ATPase [Pseudomonas aeruginosa]HBO3287866.1 AAA family ATPase [Pseudomonas aeruginosa]
MWVEELSLENIKCFERESIKFTNKGKHYKWITFLSENGCGKSTILQSLGLLLAGPEGVINLLPRPTGWLRDEAKAGRISIRIHQGNSDPGDFGEKKVRKSYGYSYHVSGSTPIQIRGRTFTEPGIHENSDRTLTWLRQNALTSKGQGWFAAGYGAFRRLTRSHQLIVPTLEPQARYTNFLSQFQEDESLSVFEKWMIYLDYRIAKSDDPQDHRLKSLGIAAVDSLLPDGVKFDSINTEGRILYNVNGEIVPTISLSDGYRSILAFAGDLIWRLILAFPESVNPAHEEGVVLIDELDIHLHPIWQRDIALKLRTAFPNIQFFVSTHSPLVAAGAGHDALTIKLKNSNEGTSAEIISDIHKFPVDKVLMTEAFGLVSAYSPQTNEKMEFYNYLYNKENPTTEEKKQLALLQPQVKEIINQKEESELDSKIDSLLESLKK